MELEPAFVNLGYELFRDREKLRTQFIFGDFLTLEPLNSPSSVSADTASSLVPSSRSLSSLVGRVTVLWASAFLHLWDLPGQKAVCHKMLLLLRDKPGVRLLGRQVGSRAAGLAKHVTNKGGLQYRHNPESFQKMWEDVLGQTAEGGNEGRDETSEVISHGGWNIKAWFEEDLAAVAQKRREESHEFDSEWLSKVAAETGKMGW